MTKHQHTAAAMRAAEAIGNSDTWGSDTPHAVMYYAHSEVAAIIDAEIRPLVEALERLLWANEADREQCPDMDVRTAYQTNSHAIKAARAALTHAK